METRVKFFSTGIRVTDEEGKYVDDLDPVDHDAYSYTSELLLVHHDTGHTYEYPSNHKIIPYNLYEYYEEEVQFGYVAKDLNDNVLEY